MKFPLFRTYAPCVYVRIFCCCSAAACSVCAECNWVQERFRKRSVYDNIFNYLGVIEEALSRRAATNSRATEVKVADVMALYASVSVWALWILCECLACTTS